MGKLIDELDFLSLFFSKKALLGLQLLSIIFYSAYLL